MREFLFFSTDFPDEDDGHDATQLVRSSFEENMSVSVQIRVFSGQRAGAEHFLF